MEHTQILGGIKKDAQDTIGIEQKRLEGKTVQKKGGKFYEWRKDRLSFRQAKQAAVKI